MRFSVNIGNRRAQERLLEIPPLLRQRLLYLRYFGGALAPTIRDRISVHEIGPDNSPIRRFKNSGGMWDGFASRIKGRQVVLDFTKTSLPSAAARLASKRFDNEKDRKEYLKKLRKAGKLKKIGNREKAKTAQASRSAGNRSILQPSRSEVNCLLTWMEEHMERNLPAFPASDFKERAVPDRFNNLLRRLPNPKNSR
jgi:hypothetical protein